MIQTKLYFNDVWKERLRQESVPKINVEWIEGNRKSYPYLYPIEDVLEEVSIETSMCALTKKASWEAS